MDKLCQLAEDYVSSNIVGVMDCRADEIHKGAFNRFT